MLISPEYRALQQQLHATQDYGFSSGRWVNAVLCAKEMDHCEDILDYGCGQGRLKAAIGDCVREYDPAIPGKDSEPSPADLVVCTDVLEHIEPDCIDNVLLHIRSKTKKRLFFNIALRSSEKTMADGRNAHLIVESASWWLDRLSPYFRVIEYKESPGFELVGIAQPISIIGEIKSFGVMKDERNDHTKVNVLKTPKRIPDYPVRPHPGIALIACYGPSLKSTYKGIEQQRKKLGATLVSVSGAHDFLRKHRITPDIHVECDPRPHKGKMMRKLSRNTRYYMASCCHPDVIDQLKGQDVTLWHLYNGPESFEIRNIRSEETAAMIPGGGSVGLRTITLLYFLGFRKFVIHGMDCSFDGDEQHAGTHSGKVQKVVSVNPGCKIGDEHVKSQRWYSTSPVLISYANYMLKDLRTGKYPGCEFFWYGDGLFQEMLKMQNAQLAAIDADAKARGINPTYQEPRDYFSMTEKDVAQFEKENAA